MQTIEVDLKHMGMVDLGSNIRVIILDIHRGRCRIGIEAPDKIRILRSELVKEISSETKPTTSKIEKRRSCDNMHQLS